MFGKWKYFVTSEYDAKFSNFSVYKYKCYWNRAIFVSLLTVYGCLHVATADWVIVTEAEQHNTEYLWSGPAQEEHTSPYFQLSLEITKNVGNSNVEQG